MAKFRKNPVIVEAVQWNGKNSDKLKKLGIVFSGSENFGINIKCKDNVFYEIPRGYWVIKFEDDSQDFLTDEEFKETYEAVDE